VKLMIEAWQSNK